MSFACTFGFHKWNGCKCSSCGKTRDVEHDWSKDCEKCMRCETTRAGMHNWAKDCEKCADCDVILQHAHKWDGCECSKCSKTRDEGHDWSKNCEKCSRCEKTQPNAHKWNGCKCSQCGRTRDEKHDWAKDCEKCAVCGKARQSQHVWSGSTCKACGKIKLMNPKDGADLVFIPAGPFLHGDKPAEVTMHGYYIYKTPVTVAQYMKFCEDTGHKKPAAPEFDPNWAKKDHPIVNVSWEDAQEYCKWAGVRLPGTLEMEKAARGTDGRKFPWGNAWDASKCANSIGQALSGTVPVGRYTDSPYGLSDAVGNVSEWCGSTYFRSGFNVNDLTPGSWKCNHTPEMYFRCAAYSAMSAATLSSLGFRCAVLEVPTNGEIPSVAGGLDPDAPSQPK